MATRMFDRRPAAALGDPQDRVATIVARHGDLLTRVARGYSLCADDAHDAVQRALEIYMRRVDSLDPATELAWMKVVVKHEALAVRRGRAGVAGEEIDLDAVPAVAQRSVEERLESAERVERSAEVMRRLKRDEARALMLKAEGLSYVEIGERLGWTYTKVNRCITEGRRRFMRLYEELETGAECERLAPTLHALAQGTADSEALLELRPHLRNCAGLPSDGARAPRVAPAHAQRVPPPALHRAGARVRRALPRASRVPRRSGGVDLHPMEHQEKLDELFRRLNAGEAAVQPVAPSVAEGVGRLSTVRINLRGWVETALQRLQSSDVALGVHAATHRRRRPDHVDRRPDRDLRQRRRSRHLLRGDRAAAGPEARDPERAEGGAKRKATRKLTGSASRGPQAFDQALRQHRDSRPRAADNTNAQGSDAAGSRSEPAGAKRRVLLRDFASGCQLAERLRHQGQATRPGLRLRTELSKAATSASKRSAGSGEFADGTGGEFSP